MQNKKILLKLNKFLVHQFNNLQEVTENHDSGGKTRSLSGETVEKIIDIIWSELGQEFPLMNLNITNGKNTPVLVKNSDLEGTVSSVKESVDRHCFINNDLILAIECKTYLDKPYMQRASSDFELMRRSTSNFKSSIVSLQDSVNNETYNFWMNEGYIDKVFFLSDVKRNSAKEQRIYYHIDWLNQKALSSLIDYMREVILNANNTTI